ncbi:glutamate synthase central domain-containing protein, partial [Klebsiella pneumoniae]
MALAELLARASQEATRGSAVLILSDRGIDAAHAAIPSLLAVSAVHQHLVSQGFRTRTDIVLESGEVRS